MNQNIFKQVNDNNLNIRPSNLKRLQDDCFPYKIKNRNVFKLKSTHMLIQVPCVTLFGGYAGIPTFLEVFNG